MLTTMVAWPVGVLPFFVFVLWICYFFWHGDEDDVDAAHDVDDDDDDDDNDDDA